jgi:hypothetical protein
MTALVFALQPDQVCIAMDTLVIGAKDRMPLAFQRKFLAMDESELLVAGTGHADFINRWFEYLRAHLTSTSIEELNSIAPVIFRASVGPEGGLDGLTVTIYHFGYSAAEKRYIGYAYRSEKKFEPDRLPDALGFKPVISIEPTDDIRFPDYLVEIVLEQQRHDNGNPLTERVGIGGEIEFIVMADRTIRVSTVHRFSCFEADQEYIAQRAED